jgi:hypothetical protein
MTPLLWGILAVLLISLAVGGYLLLRRRKPVAPVVVPEETPIAARWFGPVVGGAGPSWFSPTWFPPTWWYQGGATAPSGVATRGRPPLRYWGTYTRAH